MDWSWLTSAVGWVGNNIGTIANWGTKLYGTWSQYNAQKKMEKTAKQYAAQERPPAMEYYEQYPGGIEAIAGYMPPGMGGPWMERMPTPESSLRLRQELERIGTEPPTMTKEELRDWYQKTYGDVRDQYMKTLPGAIAEELGPKGVYSGKGMEAATERLANILMPLMATEAEKIAGAPQTAAQLASVRDQTKNALLQALQRGELLYMDYRAGVEKAENTYRQAMSQLAVQGRTQQGQLMPSWGPNAQMWGEQGKHWQTGAGLGDYAKLIEKGWSTLSDLWGSDQYDRSPWQPDAWDWAPDWGGGLEYQTGYSPGWTPIKTDPWE